MIQLVDKWATLDPALAVQQLSDSVALYKVVNVTTAQMLSNGSVPIVILPPPGLNRMYLLGSVIGYYIAGSVPFNGPGTPILYYGDPKSNIPAMIGQFNWNAFADGSLIQVERGLEDAQAPGVLLNQPIVLTDGQDYTQGNGSAKLAMSFIVADFS